jgi:glycosyltransferase involved in cell wall biosynthesis
MDEFTMALSISINHKKVKGPYGGGNQFVHALEKKLIEKGHSVHYDLRPGLDVILILQAQRKTMASSYSPAAIGLYQFENPNTAIVHRVNICDEQRGRDLGINRDVLLSARMADHRVYVSRFIWDHFKKRGLAPGLSGTVIHNRSDRSIFNADGRAPWSSGEPIKIVTHHWSDNYLKGFDIYEKLDRMLDHEDFRTQFEFTFIGNINKEVRFRNANLLPPMSPEELSQELKKHHLYVTGTRLEPGGNHYVEAMSVGLPVLHLNSGSTPEYCERFGKTFELSQFEQELQRIPGELEALRQAVLGYDEDAERMTAEYETLFAKCVEEKQAAPKATPGFLPRALRRATYAMGRAVSLGKRVVARLMR